MAQSFQTYASESVTIGWGILPVFEGFDEGSLVTLERNADLHTNKVSADSKLARAINPDRTGTVTVSLMQNSDTHKYLSAVLALQEAQDDKSKIAIADLYVRDPSGAMTALAKGASIMSAPSMGLGVESATYEWTFDCEELKFLGTPAGASTEVAGSVAQISGIASGMFDAASRI